MAFPTSSALPPPITITPSQLFFLNSFTPSSTFSPNVFPEKFEKIFNPEHPKLLSLFVYKGNFLNLEASFENALQIFKNVLVKQEKTIGVSHPDTLLTVNNLGLLYYNLGDYEKAESFYRRSIEGNEVALGKNHQKTWNSISPMV